MKVWKIGDESVSEADIDSVRAWVEAVIEHFGARGQQGAAQWLRMVTEDHEMIAKAIIVGRRLMHTKGEELSILVPLEPAEGMH